MSGECVLAHHPEPGVVCDFCMSEAICARYLCKTFGVRVVTDKGPVDYTSTADWAVCRECHDLIQVDEWDELMKRSIKANMVAPDETPRSGLPVEAVYAMAQFIKALHEGFRHHRIRLVEGR